MSVHTITRTEEDTMAGRIEIPLKKIDKGDPDKQPFYIGEWGTPRCDIDLSEMKCLIFQSRRRDGGLTLILDEKREREYPPKDDFEDKD